MAALRKKVSVRQFWLNNFNRPLWHSSAQAKGCFAKPEKKKKKNEASYFGILSETRIKNKT